MRLGDADDRAPEWAWATLAEPEAVQPDLIGRRMHDMAILHGARERRLAGSLIAAVRGRPARAAAWRTFHDSDGGGFRVSPVAVAVGQALLADRDLGDEERAGLLTNLSVHLSDSGDEASALAAIREAAEIHRRLAQANPARFEPDLASSLNNLSLRLGASGDAAAALVAIREAVEIRRRLAQANPARFDSDLARSLNNFAIPLAESGDETDALAAIHEAAEIRRRLAQANPARFDADLVKILDNLSNRLGEAGDEAGALTASREAAELRGRRARSNSG
jgi:hypothetical protein